MVDPLSTLKQTLADRYRIERELGAGGMATVYLATDLKHDREVALKVLRPELGAVLGPERFLAEIKITAKLDHPHILTLIDSGASAGLLFYVLPLVRGESLRDKLNREKQLGLDEALLITRQVAGALEFAHKQGIVHRDIKPENILIQEGEAMLADFGIALAVREAGGNRLTETGLSLGTPQYMSPEQATGDRSIDARSDIYSLGAVLYEMLAGEPPVSGPTAQAMIARLLTEPPTHLRVLRAAVPRSIDAAVTRALAKTPADRFASAADFARALTVTPEPAEPHAAARRPSLLALALGALAIGGAGYAAWSLFGRSSPAITMGRSEQLTNEAGLEIQPAISPDGRLVAYAAGSAARMRIYIRPIEGGRTIPLSDDSSAMEFSPRWSPDGRSLLFITERGVYVAPSLGGSSRQLATASPAQRVRAACWSPDGRQVAIVRTDSLLVLHAGGGAPRLVATGADMHACAWSPDGRWIAMVLLNAESTVPGRTFGNLAPSSIMLFSAESGDTVRIAPATAFNQSPVWLRDGTLLFISDRDGPRDVYAASISASGRMRGDPVRVTTGLGPISISVSATDSLRLAYAVYAARSNLWSLPVPSGPPVTAAGATQLTSGTQVIEAMRLSPDGQWLLYDSDLRGNSDIWRIPVAGGQAEQLTRAPAAEFAPSLSPDGRLLAYHSWSNGTRDIEVLPLDGGTAQRVTDTPAQESYPAFSPDGTAIVFFDQSRTRALYITRRTAEGRWSEPVALAAPSTSGDWSPDGRTIAFIQQTTDHSGPVSLVPADGSAPARRLLGQDDLPGADNVVWGADGRTLFFKAHDNLGRASFWSMPVDGTRPRLLVRFDDLSRPSARRDFATDGRRFYFTIEDRQSDVFVAHLRTSGR